MNTFLIILPTDGLLGNGELLRTHTIESKLESGRMLSLKMALFPYSLAGKKNFNIWFFQMCRTLDNLK